MSVADDARHSRPTVILIAVLFLWSWLAATPHAQAIQLPEIGEPSGKVMTPSEEQRLGDAFMRQVQRSGKVLDDPLMNDYIQTLGSRLASHKDASGHNFRFFLMDDPSINAFAGPAGHIGVHAGLVLNTSTESELASVLAHEIAHITQRHLMRAFDAASGTNLTMAAAILAAVLIGAATKNTDATIAAVTATQAAAIQQQINFTRANEKEADNAGIQILADSGYDPNGMPDFFERLMHSTRYYDIDAVPEFLLTHPVTSSRIAESRGRAGDYPYRQIGDSLDYHLLYSSLKFRQFNDPALALRYFADGLQEGRYRSAAGQGYGHALALKANRDSPAALTQLEQLIGDHGPHPAFIILKAAILSDQGHGPKALKLLREGSHQRGDSRALLVAYAEALLEQGQAAEVEKLLEPRIRDGSSDAYLYRLAAQASGANGKIAMGHLYIAEHHYHSGALEEAKRQLEIGLKARDLDYYHKARMSARLRQIDQEINEQKIRKEP